MNNDIFFLLYNLSHKNYFLDKFFIFCAEYFIFVVVIFLFLFIFIKHKNNIRNGLKKIIFIISPAAIGWAFTDVLKSIFDTPRPFMVFEEVKPIFLHGGLDSFPSGHSTFMAALSLSVFYFNKKIGITFFIATLIIGISRIISGVHFPIDIIGGFFIGIIFTFIFEEAFKNRNKF
ncbi:TPA: phosphatase PAP2 family protein [Candidatus Nomurabacteria bacterium]|nr:MAG: Phosphatase [Parcubacteria bacterium RAAC4_OD1_1]HCY26532.1 phosphatase PAP2 family protein [Candidatus Nomurabacteria bacterium]